MRAPKLALALLASVALVAAPAAAAQEGDEPLAGYVGMASGAVFSVQPIFPGLFPTGDAPFEVTAALTNANVKSGGVAYGQAALAWPGSALAGLGPLLGTAANQPIFSQVIPPFPAVVSASQDDGNVSQGVEPGPVLAASGESGSATGRVQAAGAAIPGVVTVESVASRSRAVIENGELVTESIVILHGVALGDGSVTIDAVKSVARATSNGNTSTSKGSTVLSGLEIGGNPAELSKDGLEAAGLPDVTASLQPLLDQAGITLELTDTKGDAAGGSADRVSSGLLVTVMNPAAEANPQFVGSRFVVALAPTAVGALASPPFDQTFIDDFPLPGLEGDGDGFSSIAGSVSDAFNRVGNGPSGGGSRGGGPLSFAPTRNLLEPVGGVPGGMLVGLLAVVVFGARWISRYVGRFISTEE